MKKMGTTDMGSNISKPKLIMLVYTIAIFILGMVAGVVITHDYMYNKAEDWANNEVKQYIIKSPIRVDNLNDTFDWGLDDNT